MVLVLRADALAAWLMFAFSGRELTVKASRALIEPADCLSGYGGLYKTGLLL
jgi:hypothetical protein